MRRRTRERPDVARRPMAVIGTAIAVLAMACSTPPPPVAEPVERYPERTTEPADGCTVVPTLAPGQPQSVIVDYADFIRFDGREYLAAFTSTPQISASDLGDVVTTSRCSLSELNERTGMMPPAPTDRDTGFLATGTPIHAVRGWSPACRLAAEHRGQLHVYLAQDSDGERARPAECAVG